MAGKSAKWRGLRDNVGYVGAWVCGLCGSKFYVGCVGCVDQHFAWIAWVKYIFVWVNFFAWVFVWVTIFCVGLKKSWLVLSS